MVYPMVLLLPLQTSKLHPLLCIPIPIHTRLPRFKTQPRRTHFPISSIPQNPYQATSQNRRDPQKQRQRQQQPPRTLYPGGYKRPEIEVPSFVLQLEPNDVLADGDGTLELIDKAVSKWVRIVVLNGAEASGGKLYEAACKLKSLVRDRAYLLVSERVDIAAAANASGVVLSDQGLPAIVARNTMMDSKSDSVFLPLVARNVQTLDAALNASNSEGADFLIYSIGEENQVDVVPKSVFRNVKIPIFAMFTSGGEDLLLKEASVLLKSGASGLVSTLKGFEMFSDDALSELFDNVYTPNLRTQDELDNLNNLEFLDVDNNVREGRAVAGFIKLEDREKQFIDREKSILLEAIKVIQRAAPLMEEVSLLTDAVSQIDEPFLLAIVGEFNSGKSTVINALLGRRYLKDGVVPTTNEITFLRYSKLNSGEEQRCERHPDGQYICYLPAPILKDMNIVDTPGTNVILQRQQRLTEEFVPRADLLLFVISADRPLTESEVSFLRYTQQWKKKVVFILNKSDLYQNASELEEAILFIKENTQKMLNTEHVILYPVSARSALEAKLSSSPDYGNDSHWKIRSFYEFESFLYSFLDGSTSTGMERMKLKLGTPIGIAERLLSSCETLVRQDLRYAKQDLASINDIVDSVKDYALKMESESISWRRKALSLIDAAKSRVMDLIEATLQLSNLDVVTSYVFKGQKSATMPATSRVQNDIIGPGLLDAQKLLGEYTTWLESSNTHEGMLYKESFERRWPLFVNQNRQLHMESLKSLKKANELSLGVIRDFKGTAASKLFDQEIREVFLGTFGGLGAAGFSASLLTSVLPTTLEDLLALGLCSAGGLLAISNFPARRQAMIDKVKRTADALARELEEAMRKDLLEAVENMENFVKLVAEPYQDAAQHKLENLLRIQNEISNIEKELQTLQFEIQNLHVS
ncbi:probable transmembrane GTPase FZO-like, chloroplastic [Ziziphus jujuba]|uniref:Probable transmembrane GTPase FZO-like, chloroplastic n=1 Tax=Ziziphus jujuba TaxID=326968 RepID=A0A9B4EEP8_ZIZJJ|nr:probable transmembrane GTPase FZO-like, chloroplastic [Ziziphus jujuba]